MSEFRFADRQDAGRKLAEELSHYAERNDVVVLALPRGGVPVGWEIARALHVPLDVFLVRKLGVPGHEELAMGAIATGGIRVLNESVIEHLLITPEQIDQAAEQEQIELERREREFRGKRPPVITAGRVCILVDDGLATGSTMRAAVMALKQQNPGRIVVAVPVAAADTCREFRELVDEVVCAYTPEPFHAVGRWYDDFAQLTDDDVRYYIDRAAHEVTV